jgi:2-polyprenyl-3-methyl-5-hydroxy-6-metoxy-1,4-benzoquinol methylase
LPFLSGRVLDLACGLGGLSLAAARQGCEVIAVDASPTAVAQVAAAARAEGLNVTAVRRTFTEASWSSMWGGDYNALKDRSWATALVGMRL